MTKDEAIAQMFASRAKVLENESGMTLRDYFAAKALQANLARLDPDAGYTMSAEARYAYEWADAMLKARQA